MVFKRFAHSYNVLTSSFFPSAAVRAHLRLQAATSLLGLATTEKFSEAMNPKFPLLAFTIQVRVISLPFLEESHIDPPFAGHLL